MNKLEEEKLDKIIGGATEITGTLISSFVSLVKAIEDIGYKIGSGIRRLAEDNVCPLK